MRLGKYTDDEGGLALLHTAAASPRVELDSQMIELIAVSDLAHGLLEGSESLWTRGICTVVDDVQGGDMLLAIERPDMQVVQVEHPRQGTDFI